jgi:hypothetical protein
LVDRCGIFNHGWVASYLFGEGPKSVDEAQAPIKAADAQIMKLFPSAFLSHIRTVGDLILALRNLGYDTVSASSDDYSGMS